MHGTQQVSGWDTNPKVSGMQQVSEWGTDLVFCGLLDLSVLDCCRLSLGVNNTQQMRVGEQQGVGEGLGKGR